MCIKFIILLFEFYGIHQHCGYWFVCDFFSVRTIRKDEPRYYEEMLQYSREHLMLYPYHLSDVIVKGLRITPFSYYSNMMQDIMGQEKSYDSLPNFTAADCELSLIDLTHIINT